MFQISIPKPCHEDWQKMTPTSKGAFCQSCAKEVVDFTTMTDDEVQNYFLNKPAGRTCGRFKAQQLRRPKIDLPENILNQKAAGWKKFLAVVLLAFGSMLFGCDVSTTGNQNKTVGETVTNLQKKDTVCISTMGTPALIKPDSIKIVNSNNVIVGALVLPPIVKSDSTPPTELFNGEIELVREDSVKHKTYKNQISDSTNLLNTKPQTDTLISD